MKIPKFVCLAGLITFVAPIAAQSAELTVNHVTYVCERGVSIPVVFINPANATPLAILAVEGKLVTLKNERSASGALYVSTDKREGYQFWTKGDEATLTYHPMENNAKEQTLFENCQADSPND